MNYCEQQINKQLSQVEQLQQQSHLSWMLNNNTKKSFYLSAGKDEGISQWRNDNFGQEPGRKIRLLSYLKGKKKIKHDKFTYLLDNINQEQTAEGSPFSKYNKIPSYTIKKQHSSHIQEPNKVNLKLPIPHFLQQKGSMSDRTAQQNNNSLPTIKKLAIPIKFLREKKRDRSPEELARYPLLRNPSQVTERQLEDKQQQIFRKGRMMGATRRQIKNCSFSFTKNDRNIVNNSKLQDCITFMK